jgi:hypothetical protein
MKILQSTAAWWPTCKVAALNHELDKILKSDNLLILKSHRSRQKHQKQASGTKSVQNILTLRPETFLTNGFLATGLMFGRLSLCRSMLMKRQQMALNEGLHK